MCSQKKNWLGLIVIGQMKVDFVANIIKNFSQLYKTYNLKKNTLKKITAFSFIKHLKKSTNMFMCIMKAIVFEKYLTYKNQITH